jgi:hypothetical protein
VSDSHSVPSHPVCPDRTTEVKSTAPKPAPITVTDVDPVPAMFVCHTILMLGASKDNCMLPVPTRSPTVMTTRRVPRGPCPTMQRTDVSDSHSVPSHPVSPACSIAVKAASPRLDPCTVTDADPVPKLLPPRVKLTELRSTEYASVMLPPRSPAVNKTSCDPRDPCPTRPRTDVSESHCVPSHPVSPDRNIPVYHTSPRLDPCTVI